MSENLDGSPLPSFLRPRYGVDAPAIPALNGAAGMACYLVAARSQRGRTAMAVTGTVFLAFTGVYLHTTLRGKLRLWDRELDRAGLRGNEQLACAGQLRHLGES